MVSLQNKDCKTEEKRGSSKLVTRKNGTKVGSVLLHKCSSKYVCFMSQEIYIYFMPIMLSSCKECISFF